MNKLEAFRRQQVEAFRRQQERLNRRASDQVKRQRDPSDDDWRAANDILNGLTFDGEPGQIETNQGKAQECE